jgi:hypothetical protein
MVSLNSTHAENNKSADYYESIKNRKETKINISEVDINLRVRGLSANVMF